MGSETPLEIPKVDFSGEDLKPGSHGWDLVQAQVREALERYGCFEAVYDRVPPELREAIFAAAKELFALPMESKLRNTSNQDAFYHGYIQVPQLDYESLAFDDPTLLEKAQSFTNLMWPKGNPSFCELVHSYAKKVSELDQMVRKMVLESLGLDKYYETHMESTKYQLRLSQYGAPLSQEAKPGLLPHVDTNITTIIHPNQVGGLEVQTKGGDWIPCELPPSSFLVLSGDSFRAWTNGRLHSPCHQVTCRSSETRYSVMLFAIPRDEEVIQAPEEMVDEEHPLLFRPYKYLDYAKFYKSEVPLKPERALAAFCGAGDREMEAGTGQPSW